MVRHDDIHRIEWPLGVITAIYPDDRGVIRTAEVEECGKRSLRPVSYLVPLELDYRHDDDALSDPQGNEEDDADDDEEDDAINDDSLLAENQGGSNVSADAKGQEFLPDAPYAVTSYVGQLPSERPGQRHHCWVQCTYQRYSQHHLTISPTSHSRNPSTGG